ncbi:2-dehydropantoate 2-reductase [Sporobacter termitidis DSM 10068]|uniref:2-dehydropantoate 2-reductase n=1 Tax=Sporobacter termitidis DSM 10068 TaxID=1123282 RepID=A0A1M5YMV1_9FIRM|nr:ketopantoate reductase family protein [Sporobacter termitidis]SHI12893.1 2-dehydropantoate 2-reductase [Sporobacter termitidis DSM 10068]
MEIKKVSLIGLGALGVLFAQQLSGHLSKDDLRIIADEGRIARYRRDGIFCNGERCDFNFVAPGEDPGPADLLMIAVKYNNLNEAIAAVKNHVGPGTVILSILNGISSEEIIGRTYGMDKLLLCVAQGMDAVKVGPALTYHNKGVLVFGDRESGAFSEKAEAVDRLFTRTGIAHELSPDMKRHQWSKFMFNAGVNQTTAVYLCDYEGVQNNGPFRDTMIAAMEEVIALAEKEHVRLTREDIGYWLEVLAGLNPKGKTSMQQDVEAHRLSEAEMFGGAIAALSAKHGIAAPVNKQLHDKIKALESAY